MSEPFRIHNVLEEKLLAVQQGLIESDTFVDELLDAQLFMPIRDDNSGIQGFQRSSRANPLTIEDEEGTQVLVLFTSPERAKPFLVDFPDYQGGLLAEFSWVLERIGSGVGITINPGFEVGMDFEPDMVEQLIHLNADKRNASPETH